MEAWLHHLLTQLALPEYGLSTVFVVAFVSATLLPMGSEPAVFACDDTVTEPVLLPGFTLAVEEVFAW